MGNKGSVFGPGFSQDETGRHMPGILPDIKKGEREGFFPFFSPRCYRMGIPLHFLIIMVLLLANLSAKCDINVTKLYRGDIIMKQQIKNGQYSLKKAQIKKIIDAAENPRDRIIIELLYYCGLRRAEVVNIQTANIDFQKSTLRVVGKGDKERIVPVPGFLLSDIKFYLAKSRRPYLFPAKKKSRAPLVPMAVNRVLKRAGDAAKIKNPNTRMVGINPHLLRHSAARHLKDSGVSLEAIAQFLGHEKLSITADIYGLLSFDEVLQKVGSVLN